VIREGVEEKVIDESETIVPLEISPEEQEPEQTEEKDHRGVVIRRVVRRPVLVTSKRTVIRNVERMPDGSEKETDKKVEEAPPVEEEPANKFALPLESSTTEESEEEIPGRSVRGHNIRTVKRKAVNTTQKKVVRRVVHMPDGAQEGPIEDSVIEPVESTQVFSEPEPELLEEQKDRKGVVVRRIVRRPVPVVTRRKVYRKIVYSPEGVEKGVEERVEEPEVEIPEPMDFGTVESVPEEHEKDLSKNRVVVKKVQVRKRIVRKVIIMPDGSRKEVEEEVPEEDDVVSRREVHRIVEGRGKDVPKPVERMYITRVVRTREGFEQVLDSSETVYPLDITPEEQLPESVEEEKDRRGVVIRRVVRRPVMLTTKRTVIRRSEKRPDGTETDLEKTVEESPVTEEDVP
jgi:hypothetical protein